MRAFLFVTFLLAACATPAAPAAGNEQNAELAAQIRSDNQRLDQELRADGVVSAGIGETADLGSGLSAKPLEVLEDSRCPMNVECVWAGRLRLRAEISGTIQELTAGEPLQTPQGTVLLAVVKPSPWASWPGPRTPYRFGFRRG